MSNLENLIAEYCDWKGYLVKRNIKIGKLSHGGWWEMELDVIAFDPHSWATREERFTKKFNAASWKYLFSEIYTWLDSNMEIEQMSILISHSKGRDELAGGKMTLLMN